ncbi:MAG TPA: glutamate--tRNA ligase [Syntrophomonadaceae bacterium]|jgi:nondiscriminating glutamyl-tRNA synthetase|nr:glutamate--tRNA ligase [Syntrophomonadaceae bacterium]
MKKCKVRFAPSPTGPLHIGGARSALFNYLYAQKQGGEMVLRIEDTDRERSKIEYEEEIIESLRWLGIDWTEGVGKGGENGPYRQTERLPVYQRYIKQLLDEGKAYYCFCTDAELEEQRQSLIKKGETPRYLGQCSHLSAEEVQARLDAGAKPAVRFRVPRNKIYVVNDLVRGRVSFEADGIGDFIIAKSDGLPTYNFAVVIDDVLMGITLVMRAEEHLSNTPRQLMIYEALQFPRPDFAHISLILGEDRQKMSKRHGATSLIQYREQGYLPEALFNFLSLLGWSPHGEEEILNPEEIIRDFSLERVSKSPAVFDLDKLNYINQQHIKRKSLDELQALLYPYLEQSPYAAQVKALDEKRLGYMIAAIRNHLVCLTDVNQELGVFFDQFQYEEEALEVLQGEQVVRVLTLFTEDLPACQDPAEVGAFIKQVIKKSKEKPKNVYMPLRSAISGRTHGPELPALICVLGREETLRRVQHTLEKING